jgi:hypothetical protein
MGITITRPAAKKAKKVKRGSKGRARGVKKSKTTTVVNR